jgi:hypothetical protein
MKKSMLVLVWLLGSFGVLAPKLEIGRIFQRIVD